MRKGLLVSLGILIAGCGLLAGCGGRSLDESEREALRQQRLRLEQQLSNVQQQLATVDKQITDLRALQDQQMAQLITSSQVLNQQLLAMRNELGAPHPQTLAPLPNTAGDKRLPPEVDSTWDVILKFLIALLIVGAFFFLIKFLYGRMHDEDDDDEDVEPAGQEYRSDLGTVTVAPAAQAATETGAAEAAPAAAPVNSAAETVATSPAEAPTAALETADQTPPNDLTVNPEPAPRKRRGE